MSPYCGADVEVRNQPEPLMAGSRLRSYTIRNPLKQSKLEIKYSVVLQKGILMFFLDSSFVHPY